MIAHSSHDIEAYAKGKGGNYLENASLPNNKVGADIADGMAILQQSNNVLSAMMEIVKDKDLIKDAKPGELVNNADEENKHSDAPFATLSKQIIKTLKRGMAALNRMFKTTNQRSKSDASFDIHDSDHSTDVHA